MAISNISTALPPKFPEDVYRKGICILLGTMANWILFGVLLVQIYLYFAAFPNDHRFLKLIVFMQLLLDTTQTVIFTNEVIHQFMASNPEVFDEIGTFWLSVPLMIGLTASITQWFYCYRVGMLTQSKYAVAVIGTLSLGQLAASVSLTIKLKHAMLFSRLVAEVTCLAAIGIWGGLSLACDLVIAVILSYHLSIRDTGFENTHGLIRKLIRQSIETGCVTAISAGAVLVLIYLPGNPPYYAVAASIVAKTYTNTMMAVLNSRVKLVSNAPGFEPPQWNEAIDSTRLISLSGREAQDVVFRVESEADISPTRVPGSAPWSFPSVPGTIR